MGRLQVRATKDDGVDGAKVSLAGPNAGGTCACSV